MAKAQQATLVEYAIVGDRLVIWVIQPNGEVSVRQKDLSTLSLDKASERARLAAKTGSVRGVSQQTEQRLVEMTRGQRDEILSQEESEQT